MASSESLMMLANGAVQALQMLSRHADNLTAAFVLFLGYRLMKAAIERDLTVDASAGVSLSLTRLAPGGAFALAGILIMLDRSPMSLVLYLFTLTIAVGFGFGVLGYLLFRRGVLGDSDVEAIWNNRRLLFRRAAPGSLFALFGLAMIAVARWGGPGLVREYHAGNEQTNQELIRVVDDKASMGLELLKSYLASSQPQQAVETVSAPAKEVRPQP